MKLKGLICGALLLFMNVSAEEGFFVAELKGFDKPPFIPGSTFRAHQVDRPRPPRVIPGEANPGEWTPAPSDAIVLFDGSSMDQFKDSQWTVKDGSLIVGAENLSTKASFGDCQMHMEWRAPNPPDFTGAVANIGNSGVFLMGLYEIQAFDSYSVKAYADGGTGAIYGQTPPLVNVSRRPGEWQSYDILFTAPRFENGSLVSPARITMLHNGVFVHIDTEILGPMVYRQAPVYAPDADCLPLMLQSHKSPVEYRNMWIRNLD